MFWRREVHHSEAVQFSTEKIIKFYFRGSLRTLGFNPEMWECPKKFRMASQYLTRCILPLKLLEVCMRHKTLPLFMDLCNSCMLRASSHVKSILGNIIPSSQSAWENRSALQNELKVTKSGKYFSFGWLFQWSRLDNSLLRSIQDQPLHI